MYRIFDMRYNLIFPQFFLCFVLFLSPASAEQVEVTVEGQAQSREAAVSKGLVEALQQVTGVVINSSQQSRTALLAISSSDGGANARLTEESQVDLIRQSSGVIRSYRILEFFEAAGDPVTVRMSVVIERYSAAGLGNENRRRLAVMPFTDPSGKPSTQGRQFQQRLAAYLVQTRRFAVLDRDYDSVYAREMAIMSNKTTSAAERARLGQVIGADYIIVGHILGSSVQTSQTQIPITGEILTSSSTTAGRVEYSLIEIATRQVKWTGSISVTVSDDALAARIASDIIEAIYPLRIIDTSDVQEMIINQGGDSIKAGQKYRAFALSTELFDPYTKESLGRREREIGNIEVTRVLPKMSYAKLLNGSIPTGNLDIVIRRVPSGPAPQRTRTDAGRPAPALAPTLSKLPFDP